MKLQEGRDEMRIINNNVEILLRDHKNQQLGDISSKLYVLRGLITDPWIQLVDEVSIEGQRIEFADIYEKISDDIDVIGIGALYKTRAFKTQPVWLNSDFSCEKCGFDSTKVFEFTQRNAQSLVSLAAALNEEALMMSEKLMNSTSSPEEFLREIWKVVTRDLDMFPMPAPIFDQVKRKFVGLCPEHMMTEVIGFDYKTNIGSLHSCQLYDGVFVATDFPIEADDTRRPVRPVVTFDQYLPKFVYQDKDSGLKDILENLIEGEEK